MLVLLFLVIFGYTDSLTVDFLAVRHLHNASSDFCGHCFISNKKCTRIYSLVLQQNQVTVVHTQEEICAAILPRNKLQTQQLHFFNSFFFIHVTFSACIFCSCVPVIFLVCWICVLKFILCSVNIKDWKKNYFAVFVCSFKKKNVSVF